MVILIFPKASTDGHYRCPKYSIVSSAATAEKIAVKLSDIHAVVECYPTSHAARGNGVPEWRHTRAIVTHRGDMHVVAMGSAIKENVPNPISMLDRFPRFSEGALMRMASQQESGHPVITEDS